MRISYSLWHIYIFVTAKVVGELNFWITVAASKEVRIEALPDNGLIEPRGAQQEEDDSDEESDNDYVDQQLIEPTYPENVHGRNSEE